ncbi:transcriptional regulatory protein RtcR [Prosthecobacter fusiformis]|uniref:Transcriptional regulatory protein RtcR n=1 Tax=Prosthecobacter fusiformis TaxID=48464 RepID=A0A4V3FI92_9BACT|nr:RNA repair transcriptional activator RtcR [Prosthecobacter fusiformis]TDU81443.1 transcriptional regulatory protein RtcR [Prosthecobacter fusiformis]
MKSTVVFGFLGTSLDRAQGADRWSRWRPTVSMCQQEDLLISRLELLVEPKFAALAQQVAADIRQVSPETTVVMNELCFADPWDFQLVYEGLYDFITNYAFKTEKEDYLIHLTTGTHVAQICWFLLNEANFIPARLLQTSPSRVNGRDTNSSGRYEIIDLDLSKYDRLATRFAQEQEKTLDFLKSGIATKSKAFNMLIGQIELVAVNSKAPMLIMGPTGAGKSLLTSRIYDLRCSRAGLTGRFVEVNCATLRGDQAMSALFGHRRGAFTGAQADRPGLLKEADKGLIFLDEIGELGLDEQAMLLRALEDKTFLPLGSDKAVSSDFQLIAGTNRDLRAEVAAGKFRDDLLARINLWTFTLPSLAERREDLSANLDFELERYAKSHRRQVRFNKEAREAFLKFARSPEATWSANFRDLNAAVTRMATLAPKGRITVECVDQEKARLMQGWGDGTGKRKQLETSFCGLDISKLDPFDQVQLEYVLGVCRESKTMSDAGRKLFSISRLSKTKSNDADRLKKYLARFELTWDKISGA